MHKLALPALLLVFLLMSVANAANAPRYHVIFGHLEKQGNGAIKVSTANRIPLLTRATGYEFGVMIETFVGRGFQGYVEYQLPAPAAATSGSLHPVDTESRVLRQVFNETTNRWVGSLFFHEGDPPGEWQVTVYVAGNKIFEQKFQVYKELGVAE
jgi:hypothetical protein